MLPDFPADPIDANSGIAVISTGPESNSLMGNPTKGFVRDELMLAKKSYSEGASPLAQGSESCPPRRCTVVNCDPVIAVFSGHRFGYCPSDPPEDVFKIPTNESGGWISVTCDQPDGSVFGTNAPLGTAMAISVQVPLPLFVIECDIVVADVVSSNSASLTQYTSLCTPSESLIVLVYWVALRDVKVTVAVLAPAAVGV